MAKRFKFQLGQPVRVLDARDAIVVAHVREYDGSNSYLVAYFGADGRLVRDHMRGYEMSPVVRDDARSEYDGPAA